MRPIGEPKTNPRNVKNPHSWRSCLRTPVTRAVLCLIASNAYGGLVADWTGDSYVSGQNWTSNTGGVVATVNGTPENLDAFYNNHDAVDFSGSSYFVVPAASNPLAGATQFTMVAVFDPLQTGGTGDNWWQSSGLIGMEQGGSVADWGFGWNNNRVCAGVGGPDITMFSAARPLNELTIAMFTWSGGTQKLYINGVLVDSDTGVPTAARNAAAFGLGAITGNGDGKFIGRIAELQLHNTDESANATAVYTAMRDKYISDVVLTSSKLDITGGTIVLTDTATAKVNTSGNFDLFFDSTEVPDNQLTVNKVGDVTTIRFTAPINPNNNYGFDITVPRLDGQSQSFFMNAASYKLPLAVTMAGPAGGVGSWGIREYPGANIAGNIEDAADVATIATAAHTDDTASPVFNHSDPDSQGPGSSGNFNNDFNLLTNTGANDDFVVVGRTKVTVPAAGTYTFSVHSDDGFTMRVSGPGGGRFLSAAGSGVVDPGDSQSIYLDGGTGDSNTRGVYQFDAAGTYDILYLGWDGGGGGYYEVAWAPGTFTEDKNTNTWTLVGTPSDPEVPAYRERWVTNVPGPAGTNGRFGVRTYKAAGTLNNLGDASNFLATTTRSPSDPDGNTIDSQLPYLNHRDPQDGAGFGLVPGDLPFPGNTDGNDDTVVTTAKARISIASAGTYTFAYYGDDGLVLRFKGVGGLPDPSWKQVTGAATFQMSNPNEMFFDPAGTITTRGAITLSAGQYDIEMIQWEGGGAFSYELAAAAGSWLEATTPPGGFQLVGFAPPSSTVLIPGLADPGWTVESGLPSTQAAYPFTIAGAESRINDTLANPAAPAAKTSTWDTLNFFDPQDGAEGSWTPTNAWPLNTPQGDDYYSMRARGILNITQAGTYQLGFQGDDGGYMYIYGVGANPHPQMTLVSTNHPNEAVIANAPAGGTNNAILVETATGNSRTIVRVTLQVGQYDIRTLMYEGAVGSWWEVFGAKEPVDATFVHPLLARGPGSTVNIASGIPVVDQGGVTPPNSNFRLTAVTVTGNPVTSVSFNIGSQAGATYTIQASENLTSWTLINGSVPATGTSTPFTVNFSAYPALSGKSKLFFRAVQNP